jgi:hypothetical protein
MKMNGKFKKVVFVILALTLAGCASVVVPNPSAISLESAMKSVGSGLRQLREAEGGLSTGLIADEVDVTFNVSASGDQSGTLSVEMTPIVTTGGKAGGEISTKYSAQRGNQITIKFKNIMTANTKDTLIPTTAELEKLIKIYEDTWKNPPDVFFAPPKSSNCK